MNKEMIQVVSALAELRRNIRQAGRQFRRLKENETESLFQGKNDLVYAYDIASVESALQTFEVQIGVAKPTTDRDGARHNLLKEAQMLAEVHPSRDTRDFAKDVISLIHQYEDGNQSNVTDIQHLRTN